MGTLEMLPQVADRFRRESEEKKDRVWTFTALLYPNITYYDAFKLIDDLGEELGIYIGEKRYMNHNDFYELRVGVAPTGDTYRVTFLEK